MVKFCNICQKNNIPPRHSGYFFWYNDDDCECPYDQSKLIDCNITQEELNIIADISNDPSFIQAMDKLKQEDIVEFNLKMAQFKNTVSSNNINENNIPKCPSCSSTNLKKISTMSKATNTIMFGLLGTKRNKTFHCNKCSYEW